jgi:hypothetical protein
MMSSKFTDASSSLWWDFPKLAFLSFETAQWISVESLVPKRAEPGFTAHADFGRSNVVLRIMCRWRDSNETTEK